MASTYSVFFAGMLTTMLLVPAQRALAQCASGWLNAMGVPGANGTVRAVLAMPDGSVVIGGGFTSVGGVAASNIARYNPGTNAWSPLSSGVNLSVFALASLPDGCVITGGSFFTAGGVSAAHIAKFNPATNTWSALGSGTDGPVYAIGTLVGGDLVVGGLFTHAGGLAASDIARYNPTTGQWTAFANSGSFDSTIDALAILSNGDLIAGGSFTRIGSVTANRVARYSPGGWSAMTTGTSNTVNALATVAGGDVIVGGNFGSAGGVPGTGWIARYSPATNSWSAMGGGADYAVYALALLASGKVAVGGGFSSAGGLPGTSRIALYTPDTNTWSALNSGVNDNVFAVAGLSSGEVVAGGGFTTAGGSTANGISRWKPGNTPWVVLQPPDRSVSAGETVTLSATPATGYTGVGVVWRRNGTPIANGPGGASPGGGTVAGATGTMESPTNGGAAALTITGARPSDFGEYRAFFSNTCGGTLSSAALVSILNLCPADLNGDSQVDDADFSIFVLAYNVLDCADPAMPPGCASDLNSDAVVDDADFSVFVVAYDALLCP